MRALFVSGGSVGHLAPALAVWKQLQIEAPGSTAHFICAARRDEIDVMNRTGIPFSAFLLPRRSHMLPVNVVSDMIAAWHLIRQFKPDVVLSKGGSLSVPVCVVAWVLRIPIVLHESDAVMGTANTIVSKIATTICVGLPQVGHNKRFILTGNPIRTEIVQGHRTEGLKITNFTGERPILLVMGGSQGAQTLNEWVIGNLPTLLQHCDVMHLTGRGKPGATPTPGYWSAPYVHDELKHLYKCADLAISRAGSGGIGELTANGIPAILVPLPKLAHDHQLKNARAACSSGACEVMQQQEINDHLILAVISLIQNAPKRREMSQKMASLSRPDAARQIAEVMVACVALPAQGE